MNKVRTRFAPSPTGYLHLGGARTALYSWAYARKHGGVFVLRIEDTDVERSTPEATQAILDGMQWLGLDHDEGPFYQMQRMDRYREVVGQLLAKGLAYHCYCSPEELDIMRQEQRDRDEKPRYNGKWRPEPGKILPSAPKGISPVVRFKNPLYGKVSWTDAVKGEITFDNEQLDDLIIARPDGTPTYNFCVVVDDWDMAITHVIRGDDHVNNTPRQINILKALGASLPIFGHVPMILGSDGEKLSKRHGATSVMDYPELGFLPEAMLNYLARLGWSHGDAEIFSLAQLCEWFDFEHLSKSPSQFNPEKLNWLNNQYIRQADNKRLADLIRPKMIALGAKFDGASELVDIVCLMKDRAETTNSLAQSAMLFYQSVAITQDALKETLTESVKPAMQHFFEVCSEIEWSKSSITLALKETLAKHHLKMPQLAMPLRLLLTGQLQTPAIDAVIFLIGRKTVMRRLSNALS